MKIKRGFTLTELMVTVTIIGIIAIMAVPNYYQSSKRAKYEVAITEIISSIKDARNTSITGKFTGAAGSYETPPGGYGVFIDKITGTLTSFIDVNEDQIYTVANDTTLSTYTLPSEITIKSMSGSKATNYTGLPASNTDISSALILFQPPQGDAFLNENDITKELIDLLIELERYDGNKSKILKINKISGFIETE